MVKSVIEQIKEIMSKHYDEFTFTDYQKIKILLNINKCQCPDESVRHEPHCCENTDTKKYIRDGRVLYLCVNCIVTGDEEVKK